MNNSKPFWIIMLIFFVIYISIFMASKSGYYEYENKNNKLLTEAKMKQFEEDVKNGKNIDLKNYFDENNVNYDNKVTIFGNKVSNIVNATVSKSLQGSFKIIEKLIN